MEKDQAAGKLWYDWMMQKSGPTSSLSAQTKSSIQAWLKEGEELRLKSGFKKGPPDENLDPWQQQAVDAMQKGEHVIVDAPTTAGKTRVVEAFFYRNLENPQFRAVYTTPVKSLSNDKVRELRALFGERNVGISTGDVKENLNAPIVVATLESYRNSLLGTEPDLGRTMAVFDEYHYLQDEGRGSAWEEAIILSPPTCQMLLLSASVANAEEFCDWIEKISKRRCQLVRTLHRPVPLTGVVYFDGNWVLSDLITRKTMEKRGKDRNPLLTPEALVQRLPPLIDLDLLPCIIYGGKRLSCETIASLIAKKLPPIEEEKRRRIGDVLQAMNKENSCLTFLRPQLRQMIQTNGVAYHHSGLAPPLRAAIEQLVKDGLLRFCVATMGLSLGINFSVRSTMISDFMRPGEQGMTPYAPSEILQMLGRAGRRGKDVIGFSLWPNSESFLEMSDAKRENCKSQLRQDPTTFLGLIGSGLSVGAMETLFSKSFMKHQDKNCDLRMIQRSHVTNKLGTENIPCQSPAAEVTRFWMEDKSSKCYACPYQKKCHDYVEYRSSAMLPLLHMHLHSIGALTRDDTLTAFGSLARYFPQTGGMLIAKRLIEQKITEKNFVDGLQLMASLCLPHFKDPRVPENYRPPFSLGETVKELEELYDKEMFPDLYDKPYKSNKVIYVNINPAAGYIVKEWYQGKKWADIQNQFVTEQFGAGDVMGVIYRTATFLQSIVQSDFPDLNRLAKESRAILLREPLSARA